MKVMKSKYTLSLTKEELTILGNAYDLLQHMDSTLYQGYDITDWAFDRDKLSTMLTSAMNYIESAVVTLIGEDNWAESNFDNCSCE